MHAENDDEMLGFPTVIISRVPNNSYNMKTFKNK